MTPRAFAAARRWRWPVLFCLTAVLLTALAGCSTVKRTSRRIAFDLQGNDAGLHQQLGFAGFRALAGEPADAQDDLQALLVKHLTKSCADLLLRLPAESGFPSALTAPPRLANDRVDNLALTAAGRTIGLNAVLLVSPVGTRNDAGRRGLLWFKNRSNRQRIQLRAVVYDTLTAARLLDQVYTFETDAPASAISGTVGNQTVAPEALRAAALELSEEMADDICDAVLPRPWRGYLRAASGDTLFIAAGRRSGVHLGALFGVHRQERVIEGFDGQRFVMPGERIGQIKVTAVHPDWSEAVAVDGSAFDESVFLIPE